MAEEVGANRHGRKASRKKEVKEEKGAMNRAPTQRFRVAESVFYAASSC